MRRSACLKLAGLNGFFVDRQPVREVRAERRERRRGCERHRCVDCAFTRNTVINPSRWMLRILEETVRLGRYAFAPASNGLVAENVFFFRRAELVPDEDINVGRGTDSGSFALLDNVWYAHATAAASGPRIAAFRGRHERSIEGIRPQFVDETSGDYRIAVRDGVPLAGATLSCAPLR